MWLHKTHVELEMYGLKKATKIIHVSQGYNKYFPQFQSKSTIIPNGIDLNDWTPTELVKLPGNRKYKVIYIGRFSLMKSVIELSQADIPKDIDLIFVGSPNGSDQETLKELEKVLSTKEGVYYYGPAYDQDKINILFSSDAVIMPSRHEPFGIVALEALASRNILLSSRVDGLGDFCNDNNSIDTGCTSENISKALYKFTQMTDDEKINMVTNGLDTCLQYQWDDIANQYYEAYTSLL